MNIARKFLFALLAIVIATLALGCNTTNPPATSSQPAPQNDLQHSRAVEAVIWGMPAVNYDLMLQEMLNKTGGRSAFNTQPSPHGSQPASKSVPGPHKRSDRQKPSATL